MTSSIPNGFSSEELQKLLENANTEENSPELSSQITSQVVLDLATDIHDQMDEVAVSANVPPQLLAKVVMMFTCNRMIDWHSHTSTMHAERGQHEQAIGWGRDAGKFQAITNILGTIIVDGDDDFTPGIPE